MQPYRAIHEFAHAADGDKIVAEVEAVVVIEAVRPAAGEDRPRLLAIREADGTHVVDELEHFRCAEPSYLGIPEPPAPGEHVHDWGDPEPYLEGSRLVGMVRKCKVEGCGETFVLPKAP